MIRGLKRIYNYTKGRRNCKKRICDWTRYTEQKFIQKSASEFRVFPGENRGQPGKQTMTIQNGRNKMSNQVTLYVTFRSDRKTRNGMKLLFNKEYYKLYVTTDPLITLVRRVTHK